MTGRFPTRLQVPPKAFVALELIALMAEIELPKSEQDGEVEDWKRDSISKGRKLTIEEVNTKNAALRCLQGYFDGDIELDNTTLTPYMILPDGSDEDENLEYEIEEIKENNEDDVI